MIKSESTVGILHLRIWKVLTHLIFNRHNVEKTPERATVSLVEYHLKFKLGFVLQRLFDGLFLLLGSFLAKKKVARATCGSSENGQKKDN